MKKISKAEAAKTALDLSVIFLGTLLMAFGNMAFLNPYNIVPGGFTGFAIILNKTVITMIPPGVISIILNIPLFAFALKVRGRSFGFISFYGMLCYSVLIDLTPLLEINMHSITNNEPLLATLYGGVFMGVGYGLIVRRGGSTGGSDTLTMIISKYRPGISFGSILLLIDGFVVVMSGVAFSIAGGGIEHGIPPALYAFLVIFLSSRIADYVIEGKRSARTYFIICSEPAAMSAAIFTKLQRGVTALKAKGMYTNSDKEVLMCVVLRTQSAALKKIVLETDPKAFVVAENVTEVFGEGFMALENNVSKAKETMNKYFE